MEKSTFPSTLSSTLPLAHHILAMLFSFSSESSAHLFLPQDLGTCSFLCFLFFL